MLGRFLAILTSGTFAFVSGCSLSECSLVQWIYPDPNLAGTWQLTDSGPFSLPENRTLTFSRDTLTYTYPESTQDLLNDLLLGLSGAPSSYPVTMTGPYTVNIDVQPETIDYDVERVQVDLGGLRISIENYLRPMSVAERSQFYTSMAQKLGATRIDDVASLLSAMESYEENVLLAEYAAGFLGLYDVYECDLLLQMGLGTRPASLNNPLTFRRNACE